MIPHAECLSAYKYGETDRPKVRERGKERGCSLASTGWIFILQSWLFSYLCLLVVVQDWWYDAESCWRAGAAFLFIFVCSKVTTIGEYYV